MVKVDRKRCKLCNLCVEICPVHNLEIKDKKVVEVGKCTHCKMCMLYCPDLAIEVEDRK